MLFAPTRIIVCVVHGEVFLLDCFSFCLPTCSCSHASSWGHYNKVERIINFHNQFIQAHLIQFNFTELAFKSVLGFKNSIAHFLEDSKVFWAFLVWQEMMRYFIQPTKLCHLNLAKTFPRTNSLVSISIMNRLSFKTITGDIKSYHI